MQTSPLVTLPVELLTLLPQYLPYQSTLRLIVTCQYLSTLLSQAELAALRLKDPDELYRMELATLAALKRSKHWVKHSWWNSSKLRVDTMPCYTCLKWLDANLYFRLYEACSYGQPCIPSKRRKCLACQIGAGPLGRGADVSCYWISCAKCGALAWRDLTRPLGESLAGKWQTREKPEEAKWIVGGRFCNACVGEKGDNLEEVRRNMDPKVISWKRREKLMERREGVREKRREGMQGAREREEEFEVAVELGLAELFLNEA